MQTREWPRNPKCPNCNRAFRVKSVEFDCSFCCPQCAHQLRLKHPQRYSSVVYLLALATAITTAASLGTRGTALVSGTLIAAIPVFFVVFFLSLYCFPPALAPSYGSTVTLYGGDEVEAYSVVEHEEERTSK